MDRQVVGFALSSSQAFVLVASFVDGAFPAGSSDALPLVGDWVSSVPVVDVRGLWMGLLGCLCGPPCVMLVVLLVSVVRGAFRLWLGGCLLLVIVVLGPVFAGASLARSGFALVALRCVWLVVVSFPSP